MNKEFIEYYEKELGPQTMDFLKSLDIHAFQYNDSFFVTGPTWKFKKELPLEEFLPDFLSDEMGAMRDFAAVPVNSASPFFRDPSLLDRRAIKYGYLAIDPETFLISEIFKPNPLFTYFFAGDLSVSGDRTGLALSHYDHYINKVVLDFAFPVIAKRNERVDYTPIRKLIIDLRNRGFNIKQVLFDQFQSNDCINILTKKGFNVDQVQYAESFVGNTTLHELISTDRLIYAEEFEVFIGEAKELQIVNSKRIDHLSTGGFYNSKDVWDASVNSVIRCLEDYYNKGNQEEKLAKATSILDKMTEKLKDEDVDDLSWLR